METVPNRLQEFLSQRQETMERLVLHRNHSDPTVGSPNPVRQPYGQPTEQRPVPVGNATKVISLGQELRAQAEAQSEIFRQSSQSEAFRQSSQSAFHQTTSSLYDAMRREFAGPHHLRGKTAALPPSTTFTGLQRPSVSTREESDQRAPSTNTQQPTVNGVHRAVDVSWQQPALVVDRTKWSSTSLATSQSHQRPTQPQPQPLPTQTNSLKQSPQRTSTTYRPAPQLHELLTNHQGLQIALLMQEEQFHRAVNEMQFANRLEVWNATHKATLKHKFKKPIPRPSQIFLEHQREKDVLEIKMLKEHIRTISLQNSTLKEANFNGGGNGARWESNDANASTVDDAERREWNELYRNLQVALETQRQLLSERDSTILTLQAKLEAATSVKTSHSQEADRQSPTKVRADGSLAFSTHQGHGALTTTNNSAELPGNGRSTLRSSEYALDGPSLREGHTESAKGFNGRSFQLPVVFSASFSPPSQRHVGDHCSVSSSRDDPYPLASPPDGDNSD